MENIPDYFDWNKMKSMSKTLPKNERAPVWTLPDLEGDSLKLKDLLGKYVLLDFWFIGCGPCNLSIPTLNQIHNKYIDKNLVVIGINCHSKDVIKVKEYCQNRAMEYKNLWKGETIKDSYKINAAPIFYLIDKEGDIVYSQIGHDD
ncbi:TlpA family protein disulfide reductase, partial [bacterium]|nr:TlpA family protein disulfide reductase [bacterium]